MAFTYDASTSAGRVRLLIADTKAASYIFEDDEIDAFLALGDANILLASAYALRSIAADKAKFAVYYTLRGFSMDRRQAVQHITQLADKWEEQASTTPFEIESLVEDHVDHMGRDLGNYPDTPYS